MNQGKPESSDVLPRTARGLGRAGLIPFCAVPAIMAVDPHHHAIYAQLLANYALAIICFLVGVWWGLALIRRTASALIMSNAVVIIAFFGRSLLSFDAFFVLCALLFPLTVAIERRHHLFRPQPAYYAKLRLELSAVATITLLLSAMQV